MVEFVLKMLNVEYGACNGLFSCNREICKTFSDRIKVVGIQAIEVGSCDFTFGDIVARMFTETTWYTHGLCFVLFVIAILLCMTAVLAEFVPLLVYTSCRCFRSNLMRRLGEKASFMFTGTKLCLLVALVLDAIGLELDHASYGEDLPGTVRFFEWIGIGAVGSALFVEAIHHWLNREPNAAVCMLLH